MSAPHHLVHGSPASFPDERVVPVRSPHDGREVGRVPLGRAAAVAAATHSAAEAFAAWRRVPLAGRIARVGALRERIAAGREELARLLLAEVGKPIRAARLETDKLLDAVDWFLAAAPRELGTPPEGDPDEPSLRIVRDPVGVVAAVTPFNFPVQLLSWKLCPAVLCGCTVVAKPDPRTPLSTALVARWALDAGWPPGVLNVVHGDAETGAALVRDPRVAKVAFTGSVGAGRAVYRDAADGIKRATLELGGCSALVVCEAADLAGSMRAVLDRSFYNSGQYCFRINRALVHRSRYEEFLSAFAAAAAHLVVGDPSAEDTDLGPLIDRASRDRVAARIEEALAAGGRIVLDGRRDDGSYLGPTLVADVPPDAEAMRSETFGPLVVATPFDDLDEAIALANGTEYGLAAFALAGEARAAERLASELEAGTVWVDALDRASLDAPFGGVKRSGIGVEKSRWAFDAYLQPRALYVRAEAP